MWRVRRGAAVLWRGAAVLWRGAAVLWRGAAVLWRGAVVGRGGECGGWRSMWPCGGTGSVWLLAVWCGGWTL
ncbi:hypothetical protein B0I31_101541 [Saccharothrix carnea]|uniref:Uncharacterized protein n=1 Tax=Saccharothrix carnea TaxID=1280637 RepID=A0A2P8IIK9_SACCR|nr:hypothetical protein B0I31_101541 [Saccharothrix carnea]